MPFDWPLKFYLVASLANALCTSDRDIPNSRAILAGVTPALNAARTAFNFPCGIEGETASAFRVRWLFGERGVFLRRLRSSSTAVVNLSSC
jgi:hypothetical protein